MRSRSPRARGPADARRGTRLADNDADIVTLHRYFVWAGEMKQSFEVTAASRPQPLEWASEETIRALMYMCLWYGVLRAVVEGWEELKLADPTIDSLLATRTGTMMKVRDKDDAEYDVPETYSDMLRRVRNAVFHFQRDYLDDRLIAFMQKKESVVWVRSLHEAFSQWFLSWLKSRRSRGG